MLLAQLHRLWSAAKNVRAIMKQESTKDMANRRGGCDGFHDEFATYTLRREKRETTDRYI